MFPKQKIRTSLTRKIVPISLCAVITTAALKPPVFVSAAEPAVQPTLADYINTYMALLGTGNVNAASQSYMATNSLMQAPIGDFLNGTYGVSDINSACAGEAGVSRWTSAISNNSQQVSLVQQMAEESGIDAYVLDNLTGASVGENLQASMDYYLEHGCLKPAFGGQTIADNMLGLCVFQGLADTAYNFDNFIWYAHENGWTDEEITAAMDSGLAFGSLQAVTGENYTQNFDKAVVTGQSVNTTKEILDSVQPGGMVGSYLSASSLNPSSDTGSYMLFFSSSDSILAIKNYIEGQTNKAEIYIIGKSPYSGYVKRYQYNRSDLSYTYKSQFAVNSNRNTSIISQASAYWIDPKGFYTYSSQLVTDYRNGTLDTSKKSPDIVTSGGQASGNWDQNENEDNRNEFNLNVTVNFDPNHDYVVADPQDVNDFVQDTQDAIQNEEPQVDIGAILIGLVDKIKINPQPLPTTAPNPTGVPFPTTVPYPTAIPIPTAVPDEETIPDQPDPDPKPTNTPEENEKNEQGMATPDLALKFPFCIPFDIADMFSMFMEERRAPQFHIVFDLGSWGEYILDVDLSPWDEVAALVRLLELIVFIVGLIMVARKLIGDQGG